MSTKKTTSKKSRLPTESADSPGSSAASLSPLESTPTGSTVKLSDAVTTQGLIRLVSERHANDRQKMSAEWAFFRELRSHTGHTGGAKVDCFVDCFAMHLWPSKQHWRVAYELKASRADFLRELAKPEKRQWGMSISNEFWYVTAPGVAKPEEIPAGCGLMVADASLTKLRKVVQAPQREAAPLTMNEMASMARHLSEATGPLFSYSGKDLSEADLHELLESRMDGHMRTLVREKAQASADALLLKARETLAEYARLMREAGLPPASWMESGDLDQAHVWDAKKWVHEAFSRPLGIHHLSENIRGLERSLHSLGWLESRLNDARETLGAALVATQETLRQRGLPGPSTEPQPKSQTELLSGVV